jgi:CDP-glucose 4,6-dehydratase
MNDYFIDAYKNKRVLITGHTGFKGSWLSLWLTLLGSDVIGYSLEPPTKPNLFESIDLADRITHITGDVCDEKHLFSVFEKYQPEFVFHLAAQSLVKCSYDEPRLTYDTNVMGTVNVLEAVRRTKSVKVCIIVTSDKCYENRDCYSGHRETDPMGGYDPYSSSKGCAELVTSAYRNSFFNPKDYNVTHNVALSSVRAGNVIGGGDWGNNRIIPDCVKALSERNPVKLRNPSAIRPWQYVLEPLSGYLLLGRLMYDNGTKYSDAWNFGPNNESMTVKELVELVIKQWGNGGLEVSAANHPHEVSFLKLDITKARELLGWKAIYNIYEAVERTICWYRQFYNGSKELSCFSIKEIQDYTNRMGEEYGES